MSLIDIPVPVVVSALIAVGLVAAGVSKRSGALLVLAALVVVTAAGFAFSAILLA